MRIGRGKRFAGFARDEGGATAIEYGLIAALMAAVLIGGLTALGNSNSGSWGDVAKKASDAMSPDTP
jgi:pilus assembly protein Flp/PilA